MAIECSVKANWSNVSIPVGRNCIHTLMPYVVHISIHVDLIYYCVTCILQDYSLK